jgi:hypothetical protein
MKLDEDLFSELVQEIVTNNGEGHKKLQKKVDAGDVSEAYAELIKLKANLIIFEEAI